MKIWTSEHGVVWLSLYDDGGTLVLRSALTEGEELQARRAMLEAATDRLRMIDPQMGADS